MNHESAMTFVYPYTVEPTAEGIALAAAVGADRVELYTEPYARAHEHGEAAVAVSLYQLIDELEADSVPDGQLGTGGAWRQVARREGVRS